MDLYSMVVMCILNLSTCNNGILKKKTKEKNWKLPKCTLQGIKTILRNLFQLYQNFTKYSNFRGVHSVYFHYTYPPPKKKLKTQNNFYKNKKQKNPTNTKAHRITLKSMIKTIHEKWTSYSQSLSFLSIYGYIVQLNEINCIYALIDSWDPITNFKLIL